MTVSKAVVKALVLLFVALWFILRGDLFFVLPWVILFLCFSVLLALRLSRLGEERANLLSFFFSTCIMMLALWSSSSIAADFAFYFTSCVVMLAFWSPSTAAHFCFLFYKL